MSATIHRKLGRYLIEAKKQFEHGEWGKMFENC